MSDKLLTLNNLETFKTELDSVLDGKANLSEGIVYVEGTTTTAGTWLGSNSRITSYFDGLTILYKVNMAGAKTTTLNINDLGAKTVYRYSTTKLTTHYPANSVVLLTYMADLNSGCWMVMADYDSNTNTVPSVQCETAAATAAKVGTCTNHTLTAKSFVHVNMRYTNTSAGAITLNIDSAGAKPIYLNGSATSSSNYSLPAGTYIVYYDGTNFYFRTDGKLTTGGIIGDLTGNADSATTATTATKLGSSTIGSATQPIYLNAGAPTKCTYTLGKSVPSDAVFTDTNTKVNVTLGTTTKAYLLGTSTTPTSTATGVTAISDTGVYLDTTAGTLTATKFKGDLTGNADTATTATSATTATKVGSSTVGGTTTPIYLNAGTPTACTYTLGKSVPSNAVFTDTDTKVAQTVTTTDAEYPLLTAATASKTATSTEGARFASGVTLNPADKSITATKFIGDLTGNADTATTATTATKVGSSTVGSATQPIYLSSGTPTKCTYTLGKSVPSNAVFTDTNTKVNVTLGTTTKAYLLGTSTTPTSTATGVTAISDTGVYLNTTAGSLTASKFVGDLTGNADTATSATSATTATKLGSSTVGGAAKPIYLSSGTATACSSTVGSTDTPVYMKSGTITTTGKNFSDYLPLTGGTLTGELIVNENFQVRKSYDSVEYRSYIRPANYALGDEYTTALIHYNNGTNDSQLVFNKNGVLLRDNVNSKAYHMYGQHNADVAASNMRSYLYTYGTTDLTAGTSTLATGKLYFVYEE